jgi:MFS family permease
VRRGKPSRATHYNVTLFVLALACTAFAVMQTMVIPALPVLQRELNTTTTWVTWVLTAFLLVGAVATPILGKLGDQFGKERLLAISLLIFLVGCLGCAVAWSIWSLISFRALSGAGAGVFPLSIAIIRDEFPPEKIGVGIGLVSATFGVGGGFGIVFAGLIVDNLSWRWLFIVGAIITGIAMALVHRFVPESPIKTPSRIDVAGAVLLSVALICLLVALSEGEAWGAGHPRASSGCSRGRSSLASCGSWSKAACTSRSSTCACSRTAPCCSRTPRR